MTMKDFMHSPSRSIDGSARRYDQWFNEVVVDYNLQVEAYVGSKVEAFRRIFGAMAVAEKVERPASDASDTPQQEVIVRAEADGRAIFDKKPA